LNARRKLRFSASHDRALPDYLTRHVTRWMEYLGGEKAFEDSDTHQQHGPPSGAVAKTDSMTVLRELVP
jgi:hypothetical protein